MSADFRGSGPLRVPPRAAAAAVVSPEHAPPPPPPAATDSHRLPSQDGAALGKALGLNVTESGGRSLLEAAAKLRLAVCDPELLPGVLRLEDRRSEGAQPLAAELVTLYVKYAGIRARFPRRGEGLPGPLWTQASAQLRSGAFPFFNPLAPGRLALGAIDLGQTCPEPLQGAAQRRGWRWWAWGCAGPPAGASVPEGPASAPDPWSSPEAALTRRHTPFPVKPKAAARQG